MEHHLSIIGKNSGALLQSIISNFKSMTGTSLVMVTILMLTAAQLVGVGKSNLPKLRTYVYISPLYL